MTDDLERVTVDSDEDGFYVHLTTESDDLALRVVSVEVARELIAAGDALRTWVSDHDRARASYGTRGPEASGSWSDEADDLLGAVDDLRKAAKEDA